MILIIKFWLFIMYSLMVWCASACVWYNKGLEENEKEIASLKNKIETVKTSSNNTNRLKNIHLKLARILKQNKSKYDSALNKIKEIAEDIIENDSYENSDSKARKIINIINGVNK